MAAILFFASPAVSLIVNPVSVDPVALYSSDVEAVDFVVDKYNVNRLRANQVFIQVQLRNVDTGVHAANVTVVPLDADGVPISTALTLPTGPVLGQTRASQLVFRFGGLGGAGDDFHHGEVTVDQTA